MIKRKIMTKKINKKSKKMKMRLRRKTRKQKGGGPGTRSSQIRGSQSMYSVPISSSRSFKPSHKSQLPPDSIKSIRSIRKKHKTEEEKRIDELSGKIQWLMNVAGTENTMDAIKEHFTDQPVTIVEGKKLENDLKTHSYKNILYYQTAYPKPNATQQQLALREGHWIYVDKKGNPWNAYDLNHMIRHKNQFCQTFALMYMVSDHRPKKAKYPDWVRFLEPYKYGHNICVAVEFWKYMFNDYHDNDFKDWLIEQVKNDNEQTIKDNDAEPDEDEKFTLISDDTNAIDLYLINDKLKDICDNADEISIKTN